MCATLAGCAQSGKSFARQVEQQRHQAFLQQQEIHKQRAEQRAKEEAEWQAEANKRKAKRDTLIHCLTSTDDLEAVSCESLAEEAGLTKGSREWVKVFGETYSAREKNYYSHEKNREAWRALRQKMDDQNPCLATKRGSRYISTGSGLARRVDFYEVKPECLQ